MATKNIELGDKVKDKITGLDGIAVAITEWLNGCIRVAVQPVKLKDGKPADTETFDIQQLEVVKRAQLAPPRRALSEARPGGPRPRAVGMPPVRGMR